MGSDASRRARNASTSVVAPVQPLTYRRQRQAPGFPQPRPRAARALRAPSKTGQGLPRPSFRRPLSRAFRWGGGNASMPTDDRAEQLVKPGEGEPSFSLDTGRHQDRHPELAGAVGRVEQESRTCRSPPRRGRGARPRPPLLWRSGHGLRAVPGRVRTAAPAPPAFIVASRRARTAGRIDAETSHPTEAVLNARMEYPMDQATDRGPASATQFGGRPDGHHHRSRASRDR